MQAKPAPSQSIFRQFWWVFVIVGSILAIIVAYGVARLACRGSETSDEDEVEDHRVSLQRSNGNGAPAGSGANVALLHADLANSLPRGWSSATDPQTGNIYYYNEYSQVRQWDRPV